MTISFPIWWAEMESLGKGKVKCSQDSGSTQSSGLQRQSTAGMQMKTSDLLFLFFPTWILGKNKIKTLLLFNKRVDSELVLSPWSTGYVVDSTALSRGRVVAAQQWWGGSQGAFTPSALAAPSDSIRSHAPDWVDSHITLWHFNKINPTKLTGILKRAAQENHGLETVLTKMTEELAVLLSGSCILTLSRIRISQKADKTGEPFSFGPLSKQQTLLREGLAVTVCKRLAQPPVALLEPSRWSLRCVRPSSGISCEWLPLGVGAGIETRRQEGSWQEISIPQTIAVWDISIINLLWCSKNKPCDPC